MNVATEQEREGGIPALEVPAGSALFEGMARQTLEQSVLPSHLRGQRWFGGKARQMESVRLADWGGLPTRGTQAFLTLLEVRFADGGKDLYFLPLGITSGEAAKHIEQTMRTRVLARLNGPDGEAILHDALADERACAALLEIIGGREVALQGGRARGIPTAAHAGLRGQPEEELSARLGPETSSNSLVFFGRRLLMKLFRRLEVGINPDFEIGRFLTETGDFERIPQMAGALEYQRSGGTITLAILQALVANQGDGWRHALDELGRYFERVSGRIGGPDAIAPDDRPVLELAEQEPPSGVREVIGTYLQAAGILGRRTAEMHLALAREQGGPAFAPEPMTAEDVAALMKEVRSQGRQALEGMQAGLERLPGDVAPAARRFVAETPGVLDALEQTLAVRPGALKIRVHGDYHLGQVLWVENDFYLIDFEGEPTRTVDERRAKQSPLKDVAGMLRSYDYAAYASLFAFTANAPEDFARLEPWAEMWRRWVSAAFLSAYRRTAAGAGLLPADPGQFAALLDGFTLAKAFYELVYELNNRPDWVRIPLRGILALLKRNP
jgi:maltose alpha-D-glucosyltransferase/alpha-amylase